MPLIPVMGNDGIVRLTPGEQPPPPPARAPGEVMLPGSPPLEQDIAWVFPDLAAQPLTATLVRHRVRWQWLSAVGAAAHRVYAAYLPLDESWGHAAVQLARERIIPAALSALQDHRKPATTLHIVAGLDRITDVFGAATKAQFDAVWWGLRAEFMLAKQHPGNFEMTPLNQLRYSSPRELFRDEGEALFGEGGQLNSVLQVYCTGAYDIAAGCRGLPTLAQLGPRGQHLRRTAFTGRGAGHPSGQTYAAIAAARHAAANQALHARRVQSLQQYGQAGAQWARRSQSGGYYW